MQESAAPIGLWDSRNPVLMRTTDASSQPSGGACREEGIGPALALSPDYATYNVGDCNASGVCLRHGPEDDPVQGVRARAGRDQGGSMAQEDVSGGMAPQGDAGDREESEWVAADLTDEDLAEELAEEVPPTPAEVYAQTIPASDSPEAAAYAKSHGMDYFTGTLPPDIEEVWGKGKLDGEGQPAEKTARVLIAEWGLDAFRESAPHQMALREIERHKQLVPVREAFVKAQRKKQK